MPFWLKPNLHWTVNTFFFRPPDPSFTPEEDLSKVCIELVVDPASYIARFRTLRVLLPLTSNSPSTNKKETKHKHVLLPPKLLPLRLGGGGGIARLTSPEIVGTEQGTCGVNNSAGLVRSLGWGAGIRLLTYSSDAILAQAQSALESTRFLFPPTRP